MHNQLIFSIFFLSYCCQFLCGQQNLQFSYLNTSNGLSQSTINCIYQDQSGFVWFGTDDGLNRYDGVNFKVFRNDTSNEGGLFSNAIYALEEDCNGNLLIGTSIGLNIYDRRTEKIIRFNDLPPYKIAAIKKDKECNLWIGAQNLYHYNNTSKSLTEYSPNKEIPNEEVFKSISNGIVNTIFIDNKETIWIGTENGLNELDQKTGRFTHYINDPDINTSINDNTIRSITQDHKGVLWVGTNKGLNALQPGENHFKRYSHDPFDDKSIGYGTILSLLSDHNGNLWIGTENGGLSLLASSSLYEESPDFVRYYHNDQRFNSLNANTVQSILEDKHQNIWVGTFGKGLNIYHHDAKKIYHTKKQFGNSKSINNDHVNVFYEEDDYIWIGTEGGLNRFNKHTKEFKFYTYNPNNDNSIGANAIWEIYKDHEGNLWIGTWGGGLNLYNYQQDNFRRFMLDLEDENSINSNNVFSILEDSKKNLWIGTMGGGLNLLNKDDYTFTSFTIKNSNINTNYVEDILETHDNKLLIANNVGVLEYDYSTKKFHQITQNKELNKIYVYDLFEDKNNNLWMGTENGLFYKSDSLFRKFTANDGLIGNAVKSVIQDEDGHLWLGTNNGLTKIQIESQETLEVSFKNYAVEDGLQGNEFNRRSNLYTKQGLLYFGGTNGFNSFFPNDLVQNPHLPEVAITDFKIFNKSIKIGDEKEILEEHINTTEKLVLAYEQSVFSFNYVGLNYISPENNQYAYKLDGFDENWNYVGTKKEATYTNLNPGTYTFMIKAANNDGLWNPEVKKIKMQIKPPFYLSIPAYVLYGLLFVVGLWLFRKYSVIANEEKNSLLIQQLERKQKEEIIQSKLEFFTNFSHEIRTPLTLIDGPVADLLHSDTKKETKDQLLLVHQNIKRLKYLVNQLLDFRKLDTGNSHLEMGNYNLISLIEDVTNAFQQNYINQQISFQFIHQEDEIYFSFDYQKISTVFFNLISNAVKYNKKNGSITVSAHRNKNFDIVEIIVKDTGIGIPKDQIKSIFNRFNNVIQKRNNEYKSSGIGLSIAKEYIRLHKGKVWVESQVGKGSVFNIHIPMKIESEPQTSEVKGVVLPIESEYFSDDDEIYKKINNTLTNTDEKLSKALIIEDNKVLVKYMNSILMSDYVVKAAANGREGIALAKETLPDIIISDVMMPEMDGLEMCRILRNDIAISHIPVILLTAKASDENLLEGIESGADTYIMKPFNREILLAYSKTLIDARNKIFDKINRDIVLTPKELEISTLDQEFLVKLMEIMEENFDKFDFDVKQLSELMNISYRGLARKIKALTNQNASEFLRNLRLKKAAVLLEKGKLPVNEISVAVGFNDPAYFSRCFKNQFGVSPSTYTANSNNI